MKGCIQYVSTYNSMTLTMTSDEENWMNTSVHAIQMVSGVHIMNENSAAQMGSLVKCTFKIFDSGSGRLLKLT